MLYNLMHKDIVVALLNIDEFGRLVHIDTVAERQLLPLGCQMNNIRFRDWWRDRAIPSTRSDFDLSLKQLGYLSSHSMLVSSLALSLNDCYWVKPIDSDLCWRDVNLFTNDFVDRFGEFNCGSLYNDTKYLVDVAVQGNLKKVWRTDSEGNRFLTKLNDTVDCQQSLNEVFASLLHRKQGCEFYTRYCLDASNNTCISFNFCDESTESISCWEVLQTVKVRQGEYFYKFKEVCIEHGIPENVFDLFMSYQIMTDFLLSNTDRHLNNISILRDSDTLNWLGFAPIYDFGNSMFFDVATKDIRGVLDVETHSFVKREVNLLKYVTNRQCINLDLVPTYPEFFEVYSYSNHGVERIDALYNVLMQKVRLLKRFQNGEDLWKIRYSHKIK